MSLILKVNAILFCTLAYNFVEKKYPKDIDLIICDPHFCFVLNLEIFQDLKVDLSQLTKQLHEVVIIF